MLARPFAQTVLLDAVFTSQAEQPAVCNGGNSRHVSRLNLPSALPHGCSISGARPGELAPMGSVSGQETGLIIAIIAHVDYVERRQQQSLITIITTTISNTALAPAHEPSHRALWTDLQRGQAAVLMIRHGCHVRTKMQKLSMLTTWGPAASRIQTGSVLAACLSSDRTFAFGSQQC